MPVLEYGLVFDGVDRAVRHRALERAVVLVELGLGQVLRVHGPSAADLGRVAVEVLVARVLPLRLLEARQPRGAVVPGPGTRLRRRPVHDHTGSSRLIHVHRLYFLLLTGSVAHAW